MLRLNDKETKAQLDIVRGRKGDIVHVAYGYGLFTGGLGAHYGAEKLGCTVIPMSGGQTEKQVQLICDFKPDIIMVTPSYMLNIADEFRRQGIDPRSTNLRIGIHGAEPWTDAMRNDFIGLIGAGPGAIPVWESLDQEDLITRLIPEWEPTRSAPQHNPVHIHTVDRHSLQTAVCASALARDVSRPDLLLTAAILHDIGKPRTRRFTTEGGVSFHHHEVVGAKMTRKRMRALRFSKEVTEDVARLVDLHLRFHGYSGGEWTDSAVRRYVRDAGPLLPRLHKLTRADCTTRNRRKAAALQASYDSLERRIDRLAAQEELEALRPELDGEQIMRILQLDPGPQVGEAYRYLLEVRLERGPIGPEAAEAELLRWWRSRPGD